MRRALVTFVFLFTANLVQAQPGLEAYDRGDLDAVRAYLSAGKGSGAEADFLRAALTADGDSAAELYRQVAVKYPDLPVGNRALKRLHDYYYAKGLYAKAEEVIKNPGSLKYPLSQTDTLNSTASQTPGNKSVESSGDSLTSTPKVSNKPQADNPPKSLPAVKSEAVKSQSESESPKLSDAGGYALQLGSFANPENVQKLKSSLEKAGYTVEVTPLNVGGEHLQRIRAVGFKDKDAALAAAGDIKKKFSLNPVLLSGRD
jgi:cell division septation protein DedD